MNLGATILITTKNRKNDLKRALTSAVQQTGVRKEIIVIDDGSMDGSQEMVLAEFPSVRLYRSEISKGRLFQRNRAVNLATEPIIVTLDDDAAFSSHNILNHTLNEFDNPRVGAVLIPLFDVFRNSKIELENREDDEIYIKDAILAGSCAIRVDVFKELGGYREEWYYAGEEEEFSARLLQHGYIVRFGRSDPIYHYVSPVRKIGEITYYTARNSILFVWAYVPITILPIHLIGTIINNCLIGIKSGGLNFTLRGLFNGFAEVLRWRIKRYPLSYNLYKLLRRIKKEGPLPLSKIEHILPCLHRMRDEH